MTDIEPQVPEEGERRRRRVAWWIWLLTALLLIGAGLGSYAGEGGFSGSNAASQHHGQSPASSPSGGSSSGSGSGSASAGAPAVGAGGGQLGIPPAPVITSEPSNPSTSQTAAFSYDDAVLLTSFRCSLDGSAYSQCGAVINLPSAGAITYTSLSFTQHCFSVEGVTALLLVSVPTTYCWQINGAANFTMSWTDSQSFYPGTSQSVNMTIANPNSVAITIPAGGITITISTNKAGCPASANFTVSQGLTSSVTIPANTTEALSVADPTSSTWPSVSMLDTNSDQDACLGATVSFTFSGTDSVS